MTRLSTARAQFLVDNLDLAAASGIPTARWEHFQLAHLQDNSLFRIENKARQIAWSFLAAAEAVADAVLHGTSSAFISLNLDEAQEKIMYALSVYRNLRISGLPEIINESSTRLMFRRLGEDVRILSLPHKPARGKARMNLYLDEFAHGQHDKAVYRGSLPVVSKGGRLRMGSSPMGASGVFWEIDTESLKKYPGFTRKRTPWWEVYAFCTNPHEARQQAPALTTAQRVGKYGEEVIRAIFANMPREDFQQEYECMYVDESVAWITWDEIKRVQDPALVCETATARGTNLEPVYTAVDKLAEHLAFSRVELAFAGGYDVGRTRNASELFLTGRSPYSEQRPLRLALTLEAMPYDEQLAVINYVMVRLPVVSMLIDKNGLGNNLAESAEKEHPYKAQGVNFTNQSKVIWATDAKMLISQGKTPLPAEREIAYQIHSIKRKVTAAKNMVFDTERNEKHHADKFWAWALSIYESGLETQTETDFSMLKGYRG